MLTTKDLGPIKRSNPRLTRLWVENILLNYAIKLIKQSAFGKRKTRKT